MDNDDIETTTTELRKASDILDIGVDYISNAVRISVLIPGHITETFSFGGLIDLHYTPDFSDSPPWIIREAKIEKLSDESDLTRGEGLWARGKGSYADAFPCYRFSLQSRDFYLTILCLKIEVLNHKSGTGL